MTQTCLVVNCPFCSGEACRACTKTVATGCPHDPVERHAALPAVADVFIPRTGTPTEPLAKALLTGRIDVDFSNSENADATAEYLELVARIIRLRKRMTIIIE